MSFYGDDTKVYPIFLTSATDEAWFCPIRTCKRHYDRRNEGRLKPYKRKAALKKHANTYHSNAPTVTNNNDHNDAWTTVQEDQVRSKSVSASPASDLIGSAVPRFDSARPTPVGPFVTPADGYLRHQFHSQPSEPIFDLHHNPAPNPMLESDDDKRYEPLPANAYDLPDKDFLFSQGHVSTSTGMPSAFESTFQSNIPARRPSLDVPSAPMNTGASHTMPIHNVASDRKLDEVGVPSGESGKTYSPALASAKSVDSNALPEPVTAAASLDQSILAVPANNMLFTKSDISIPRPSVEVSDFIGISTVVSPIGARELDISAESSNPTIPRTIERPTGPKITDNNLVVSPDLATSPITDAEPRHIEPGELNVPHEVIDIDEDEDQIIAILKAAEEEEVLYIPFVLLAVLIIPCSDRK
jgi:hypothetical protein